MLNRADGLYRRLLEGGSSYSALAELSVKHGRFNRFESRESKDQSCDGLPGCSSFIASVGSALDVILRECFSFVVSVRSILPTDPPLLLLPKLRMDIDRGRCPDFPGMAKIGDDGDFQRACRQPSRTTPVVKRGR